MTQERLSEQIVERTPVTARGASGNEVEHVVLADGRRLVHKRVSPADDWISRATGDDGRALEMWRSGLFDLVPGGIDHTTVAVEGHDDGSWSVFMHDVSDHLVHDRRRLDREDVRRIVTRLADLHRAFADRPVPPLCTLSDRYNLLSKPTARRESDGPVGPVLAGCWDVFGELAPDDVATPILALAEDPTPLVTELLRHPQTLIHGDVRLSNLGLDGDRLLLVDWGERTGPAPGAVEIASFIAFDADQLDVSADDVVADYRAAAGDLADDATVDLAMIGGLVQLGCNHVLDYVLGGGDEARAKAERRLAWWSTTVRAAFERTWSPV